MIIFYTPKVEDILLASIVKHNNPNALLIEYEDNQDIISIAKMFNESNFIRVKDYKQAINNSYKKPNWFNETSKTKFLEIVLAHKDTITNEVISYVAKYLFHPEQLFYGSLDKTHVFKHRVMEVLNEINVFKRNTEKFVRKGLIFYEINPTHNIKELYLQDLMNNCQKPIIVLNKNNAIVGNALELGFESNFVELSRFEAMKLKKIIIVKTPIKNIIKKTITTRLCEF